MNNTTNIYKRFLLDHYFPKILSCNCPRYIPLGQNAKQNNCFVVRLADDDGGDFQLSSMLDGGYGLSTWDGNSYSGFKLFTLDQLLPLKIKIDHYYKGETLQYKSIFSFALDRFLGWSKIRIQTNNLVNLLLQFIFNKRKLQAQERFQILEFLMNNYVNRNRGFTSVEVAIGLYSERVLFIPNHNIIFDYINKQLKFLTTTGELKQRDNSIEFELTGEAWKALTMFQEEDRRHSELRRIQYFVLGLTFTVAFFTAVQAELIKIPTLIDLTKNTTSQADHK